MVVTLGRPAPLVEPATGNRRLGRRSGLAVAITILAGSNVVSNLVLTGAAYLVWNLSIAGVLLVLARWCGLTWTELGLGNERLRRGLLFGVLAVCAVLLVYSAGLALPSTRALFFDHRAAISTGTLLTQALVTIPLGTVVLEEVAFRGVLPALFGGTRFWPAALAASGLFGLWHVLPSLGLTSGNAGLGASIGGLGVLVQTGIAVVAATAAGLVLMAYRRWGGHLISSAMAHLATNSIGLVMAWLMVRGAA